MGLNICVYIYICVYVCQTNESYHIPEGTSLTRSTAAACIPGVGVPRQHVIA